MNNPAHDNDQEPELDPAAQRIQQKLRRLLMGSSFIMVLGLIAVLAAIIYRINRDDPSASDTLSLAATIAIDENASIKSVQVDGDRIFVLVDENGATALLMIDAGTGRLLNRTEFVAR
ncbi:MAG: DUF6476 family protein [Stappiaceae bacterium]